MADLALDGQLVASSFGGLYVLSVASGQRKKVRFPWELFLLRTRAANVDPFVSIRAVGKN